MEIRDVFSANPKSVWEYLCENGQGLYIPAYQRQYSWDRTQILRLIEDICHGFSMLIKHKDAITFIGTIIAIHDTEFLTVEPKVRGDVPAKVMTIIDGQQRLSTILIINTVFHEEIRIRSKKLNDENDGHGWLFEECMKVLSRLGKTFEEDKDYGDGDFRYYPRMIRAYDDSWSRKKDKASYISPIGSYLHSYGNYCRDKDSIKPFKYQLPDSVSDDSKYTPLRNGRVAVQSFLKSMSKISNGKDDDKFDIPSLHEIISSSIIQTTLLKAEIPDFVESLIKNNSDKNFEDLLLMVFFANFILDRIAITIVTAKNEDYAFDMFESLNTTGEPLTAFETFKPRVIYFEGLESYKDSNSYRHIELTENYLESVKPKDKQDVTSRLIISFALAEQGIKMSKKLSDQRRFLKESYEQLSNEEEKRSFVKHLSHIALFMENVWPIDKSEKSKIDFSDDDDLILCIDFLRKLNHTITIGLIARFYSKILSSRNEERSKTIVAFMEIVKASVAFSILWRASRIGTDAIDTVYRDLMQSGCPELQMSPLARAFNKDELPDVNLVKQTFLFFLKEKGGIESKDDWIRKTSRQPVYKQPFIVRFLLLAASHDSTIDKDNPGLLTRGKDGLLSVFNFKTWNEESSQTVEHIAPQTRSSGWSDEIYEDTNTVDRLGNLALLPASENASLSNRSWAQKRLIYKILSSETIDDLNILLSSAKQQDIEISPKTTDLLERSRYLPMLKSISNIESEWSLDIIERRGNRIADMAWQRIFPWLEI